MGEIFKKNYRRHQQIAFYSLKHLKDCTIVRDPQILSVIEVGKILLVLGLEQHTVKQDTQGPCVSLRGPETGRITR